MVKLLFHVLPLSQGLHSQVEMLGKRTHTLSAPWIWPSCPWWWLYKHLLSPVICEIFHFFIHRKNCFTLKTLAFKWIIKVLHCGFNLHLPNYQWRWKSFKLFIAHFGFLFCEMPIQIFCPFVFWVVILLICFL